MHLREHVIIGYSETHMGTVLGNVCITTNDHSHTILVRGLDRVSKCMMIPT